MKPEVGFSSFEEAKKLEIVYGQVIEIEEVPKSDKLYKLSVDFGTEFGTKTILSALKESVPDPNDIKGNCYFFILNFTPRKMMGILSEGMILPMDFPGCDFSKSIRNSFQIIPTGTKLFQY